MRQILRHFSFLDRTSVGHLNSTRASGLKTGEGKRGSHRKNHWCALLGAPSAQPAQNWGSLEVRAAGCCCVRHKYRGEVKAQGSENDLENIMHLVRYPQALQERPGLCRPLSLPLCCSEKSRAEENHLLTDGGGVWPLRVPLLPFPARAVNYPQHCPSRWALVSTRRVLISRF